MTKTCRKCGETKPCEEFYKHKTAKDGRLNQCRQCHAQKSKAWHAANLDKAAAAQRRYRSSEKGIAARRAHAADYYARHRDQSPEKFRRRWETSADAMKARARARHQADPRKHRARLRVWRAVQAGLLQRATACETCGSSRFVEAHHDDYDAPL